MDPVPVRLIVSFDGDKIGRLVGRATLADDLEGVRRIDQAIIRGNEVFRAWALAAGGSIVEMGGDEGRVEVPAQALKDLAGLRANYESAVDASVSVGVGKKLSESAKALLAAKLRGGNRVVFYDAGVEAEVSKAQKTADSQSETQKVTEEYLSKADDVGHGDHGGGVSKPHKQQPTHQTAEHSQGEVAEAQAEAPPVPQPAQPRVDFEGHFRTAADAQDTADKAAQVRQSQDFTALKEQVATALEGLRKQLPVLQQLKTAYPQTYQSVLGVVQSVISLGRQLQTTDDSLAKAEASTKVWKSPGWGRDIISIPSRGHAERKAWDKNILGAIAQRYTRGDATALKPVKIPLAELGGGNSAGAANPDRLGFYRKMYRAGDRPHPVVAMGGPGNYRLVDGTHRAEAARAEGLTHIHAVVIPSLRKAEALAKAVTTIPAGKPKMDAETNSSYKFHKVYDYSHVLPEEARNKGIHLEVHHYGWGPLSNPDERINAQVRHPSNPDYGKEPIGYVTGVVKRQGKVVPGTEGEEHYSQDSLEPHSELSPEYHGQGLGTAMYEAAFAHAKNVRGIDIVHGGMHSAAADRLHKRLAAKHGFEYQAAKHGEDEDDYPYGGYQYALKSEIDSLPEEAYIGKGKGIVFGGSMDKTEVEPGEQFPDSKTLDKAALPSAAPHKDLILPVGTQHHGQIKVTHADGQAGWKGVRAGLIQGQEPNAPLMGANSHPVSSREPGAK